MTYYSEIIQYLKITKSNHEDVAYFTPFYLKDFVAKPSKPLL